MVRFSYEILLLIIVGIAISNSQDHSAEKSWLITLKIPLSDSILDKMTRAGASPRYLLRWQQSFSTRISEVRANSIRRFDEVRKVIALQKVRNISRPAPLLFKRRALSANGDNLSAGNIPKASAFLRDRGIETGAGNILAVIDAGFVLDRHRAFRFFSEEKILDRWDFVNNRAELPEDSHGSEVLSIIVSPEGDSLAGIAPKVKILLYASENIPEENTEEEVALAAAIERATEYGANVINISLGYRYDYSEGTDLSYNELDGNTRPASIAAREAAKRGIVMVVAMGNEEGLYPAPTIGSPADANGILAVGAVDLSGSHCGFSSTGPTADGRIKPDISAPGCPGIVADVLSQQGLFNPSGTSYAAPYIAGVALMLKSYHPKATAAEIRTAILETASNFSTPDNLIGHGMVDAYAALRRMEDSPTFEAPPLAERTNFAKQVPSLILDRREDRIVFSDAGGLSLKSLRIFDIRGHELLALNNGGESETLTWHWGLKTPPRGIYVVWFTLNDNRRFTDKILF